MTVAVKNDLVLRAARGEKTERTPVWLMRQAGRTDPNYVLLKEDRGLHLEQMFRNPELAAEVSCLPQRLGVDAIIVFQDILTPLDPMGAPFIFRPGPVLEKHFSIPADIERLNSYDVAEELAFVPESIRLCYEILHDELPVLGFAGAPFTLAVFLLEGKSFGDSAPKAEAFFEEHPELAYGLLEKLTDMTIDYLKLQIEAGAVAVQLFESAAHLAGPGLYNTFALPCQQRIFAALKGLAPTIHFARNVDDVAVLKAAGADVVSLPCTTTIEAARKVLGANHPVQGNVDNALLVDGTHEEITKAVEDCIRSGNHHGHIFNLSHGLLRETPYENVQLVVNVAKSTRV